MSDNGKGIPADQLEYLFKPFYTTKKLNSNNYGLGLTHCYVVMEQHKGRVEVESEEGKGTCFTLIFPA
ncbi:MAG TPA: sensor histidine kinase [Bacillota bacterium]|nr:sensor histidine kinase [Bacillota bacterium]HOL09893.1 sensor histidine kinase [Bacillota bacterium]HPO98151.1 sensor histidine kinase [Bacillota bacterium]